MVLVTGATSGIGRAVARQITGAAIPIDGGHTAG